MSRTKAAVQREQVAEGLVKTANQLKDYRKYDLAVALYRRALALLPRSADVLSNLGATLWLQGKFDEARAALEQAIKFDPSHRRAHANLGSCLISFGELDAAIFHFNRDVFLNGSEETTGRFMRGFAKLDKGDWAGGFQDYETRMAYYGKGQYDPLGVPAWTGDGLGSLTLGIKGEQGLGDCILFSRFLPELHRRHPEATIKLQVNHALTNLLWEYREIVEFVPEGAPLDADVGVYMASLPLHLGLTQDRIPKPGPAISGRVLDDHQRSPLAITPSTEDMFKIGIVWSGNPGFEHNHRRSIPAEMMFGLLANPGIVLYSMQLGAARRDFDRLGAEAVACDLGPLIEPRGLVGTGNVMLQMDLVITVCTSVAHLAGSIGVPVWTLLTSDPYWIWGRSGDKTPWYPSMRLFRQRKAGDWESVMGDVMGALSEVTQAKFARAS